MHDPTLKVNARGIALVEYTTAAGLRRHVLVWGAIDGIPHQTNPPAVQPRFQMDYSGGWKSRKNPSYWRSLRDGCARYDGPALPFFVVGCKAPDGTYWALQAWQRNLPMRGFAPWTAKQRGVELHVSHWSGELPRLEVYRHWTYGRSTQGLFGRLLYRGQPVFGTRTPSATVRDEWARNVSIDTFDSDFGPGWKHDTAIATHPGNGGFCYSFVPQAPPSGYPKHEAERKRPRQAAPGLGDRPRRDADRADGAAAPATLRRGRAARGDTAVRRDPRRRQALRAGAVSARPQGKRSVPGARSSSPPFRHSGGTRYAGADFA